jgi:hypothetical protein
VDRKSGVAFLEYKTEAVACRPQFQQGYPGLVVVALLERLHTAGLAEEHRTVARPTELRTDQAEVVLADLVDPVDPVDHVDCTVPVAVVRKLAGFHMAAAVRTVVVHMSAAAAASNLAAQTPVAAVDMVTGFAGRMAIGSEEGKGTGCADGEEVGAVYCIPAAIGGRAKTIRTCSHSETVDTVTERQTDRAVVLGDLVMGQGSVGRG